MFILSVSFNIFFDNDIIGNYPESSFAKDAAAAISNI
jgi:hypothetical protein